MIRLVTVSLLVLSFLSSGPTARGEDDLWEREWMQTRTASVRVHHEVGEPVPLPRLRELEAAVQRLSGELGLSPAQLASFRAFPIEYLYLPDAGSLKWFGVDDVDGMALVGERRVVAARLPHEHELVHVLSYVAIEPAPAHNHPWIQEGLASYLGGHLGESPLSVLALGDHVLDRNPGLLPRILTVAGFRESPLPAEECYAAAARFVHYLDAERGGRPRLLELLRVLSGFEEEVAQRPGEFVEVQIEGTYGARFGEILEDFARWRRQHPVGGLVATTAPARAADLVISDADHLVRWWTGDSGWVIAVTPKQAVVDLALVWGGTVPQGAWTSPGPRSGYELRMDEEGGRLIDHGVPTVALRWFDESGVRGERGELAWYFPAHALGSIAAPGDGQPVGLWSQPRFEVD